MEKRKILFAINDLGIGGAQNLVLEQITAIAHDDFDPYLLTIYKNPEKNLSSAISIPDWKYIQFRFKNIFDIAAWVNLYNFLRKEKFDAIITNLFDANFVVRILAIMVRTRVILSHEHNLYEDKKMWQKLADKILSYFTRKVIVVSKEIQKFTMIQEKIPSEKLYLNYNAAYLTLEDVKKNRDRTLEKYNLPTNAVYVVTAGRLIEQKGHRFLIEAAKNIVTNVRKNTTFLIFGEGILESALAQQIRDNGLEQKVRLMKIAPMRDILAMSDVFVLPSLWEGLSIALIQAMGASCPIVATRVSGTEEAIVDHENGLLVPPGAVSELTEALVSLILDESLRIRLGAAARESAQQDFSIERNVKNIEGIIVGSDI